MGRGSDVICFCGQDWWYHNRAHSDFQLMLQIARQRRVLLINSIGMRMPRPGKSSKIHSKILRKLKSILKFVRRPVAALPELYVMSPVVFPAYGTPWLRGFASWLVRIQVQVVSRWLGIRNPSIVVTVPTAWEVVRPMRRAGLFYNRSDKHSNFQEADQDYIRSLEHALFANADRVLYVSQTLMAEDREACGDRAYFLDHGVDLEKFAPQGGGLEPADLAGIPRPRVGFFGGLRDNVVDIQLLEQVAAEMPEAQLVLVGDTPGELHGLAGRDNVHLLGFKTHEEIPDYGAGFDVGLMPYLDNEWIRSCNPIKLKEYLALGLPVVSTDFPAAWRFGESVAVAADRQAFIERVRQLVALDDEARDRWRAAGQDLVADQSWRAKGEELLRLMDEVGGEKER